jgi:hypothetical protein
VRTIGLDELLLTIDAAEGRASTAWIGAPGLPADESSAWVTPRVASDLFLLAFARLLEAFSRPDHPSELGAPRVLEAEAASLAVWDFETHEVVLATRPRADGAVAVVLEVRPTR